MQNSKPSAKTSKFSRAGLRALFRYLLDYRGEIILLSILGIISALANGIIPYVTGLFLDALLEPKTIAIFALALPFWLLLLIIWTTAQLIANSVDWIVDRKRRYLGTLLLARYPAIIISSLLLLPVAFHRETKTGEIWDKIRRANHALSSLIETVVINITPQLLSGLVGLVVSFIIHPLFTLILLAGVSLYLVTLLKLASPIGELMEKGHQAWNDAFGLAGDALANYQAVKQATAEDYERQRIKESFTRKAMQSWYRIERIWSALTFYQRVIVALTQFSIFAVSVGFVQSGVITIGELVALNGYAALMFIPFVQLGHQWQHVQDGLIAIERAEELLSLPPEHYFAPVGQTPLGNIAGEVEFRNVSFRYKDQGPIVLHGLSFRVKPGEVVALVGESGVGKSTTIELISGYYRPSDGEVLIDGRDIRTMGLRELRQQIAVVPQEVVLANDTIEANIRYGRPDATKTEVEEAARRACADIFVKRFPDQYQQLVGERGVKLSVGEKQRIGIARAILRQPKILILDEPTSALDAKTEKFITESLEELMKGRTTFIIAHRLSTVRKADRVLVFESGRIVEEGKHDDLINLEGGIYQRLYRHQIGLH